MVIKNLDFRYSAVTSEQWSVYLIGARLMDSGSIQQLKYDIFLATSLSLSLSLLLFLCCLSHWTPKSFSPKFS